MPRWRWRELLDAWLNAETYREERRFLEDHRELLDSTTIVLLGRRAKKSHASPVYREHAALLDDALRRGGDRAAIREAYINMYGGLADEIPAWLEELDAHLRDSGKDRRRDQTAGERVAWLRAACLRAQQDTGVSPEAGAELSMRLWDALDDLPSGHHSAINEQEKVTCLVRALRAYSIERYPRQYGSAQNALAQTYVGRRDGSSRRGLYIELAIAHCQAALLACPQTQYPDEWAVAQMILGQAYRERPHGNQRDNLERAIKNYSACLEIWQREGTPAQNALVLNGLGNAYADRIAGNRRDNLENSIAYYEQALTIYTRDDFPLAYAQTCSNLAGVYQVRMEGDPRDNLESALDCCNQAIEIYTRDDFPVEYAAALHNLGSVYRNRIEGSEEGNLEDAISCYEAALQVRTLSRYPLDYAMTQSNLGVAWQMRVAGDPSANMEEAIACYQRALGIYDHTSFPEDFARIQHNLGSAYQERIAGDRHENLMLARDCYQSAIEIYTPDLFPIDHRDAQLNLAWLALDGFASLAQERGDPNALRDAYASAHAAFMKARDIQRELVWLESDEQGKAHLQGSNSLTREMFSHDAWCLAQLGELREAVSTLEAGRAQALIEAQAIAGATLQGVCQHHAARFLRARHSWHVARGQGDAQRVRQARVAFVKVRQAIHKHCQPAFLSMAPDYSAIVAAAGSDRALVYLAATSKGGMGLVVSPAFGRVSTKTSADDPVFIPLPLLTWATVDDWLVRPDDERNVVGGYQFAVGEGSVALLRQWIALADSDDEQYWRLSRPLGEVVRVLPAAMETLRVALQDLFKSQRHPLDSGGSVATLHGDVAGDSIAELEISQVICDTGMIATLNWSLLRAELDLLLPALRETLIEPLRAGLHMHGLGELGQQIALIPCGRLGIFPLHAVPISADGAPIGETCEISYQPNARVLAAAQQQACKLPASGPILAVGNPQQDDGVPNLVYAAREAVAVTRLARHAGRTNAASVPDLCLLGAKATRARVLAELKDMLHQHPGAWLHFAGHGQANVYDPRNSYLLLSGRDAAGLRERLSLAMLQRGQLLTGVRGVVASGCVTGLGDVDLAPDEISSLAAGMLQAGATCVVATLWSVKDHATCLLMVRFHQLRLDGMRPTVAMREAAHWLRTATRTALDHFAREVGLPTFAHVDVSRDALRGIMSASVNQEETAADTTKSSAPAGQESQEWFGEQSPNQLWPESINCDASIVASHDDMAQIPYSHPAYWAAACVYGY